MAFLLLSDNGSTVALTMAELMMTYSRVLIAATRNLEDLMETSLVRVTTPDGIELQGLNYRGIGRAAHAAVVHLHGTWGNFYGNPFIDHFARFYPRHGYSFLTVNTRGHDAGAITERFELCAIDITTWLGFARQLGYDRIILQGHSLGALKVIYYLNLPTHAVDIHAIVLLSPFDIIAFYCSNDLSNRTNRLNRAREIAQNDPDAILPGDTWDAWLLSAGTYLDLVDFNTRADIFPFRVGSLVGTALSVVSVPTFAAIGSNDFAAYPSGADEFELLQQLPNVNAKLIDGAPHNFANHETDLLKHLAEWLK